MNNLWQVVEYDKEKRLETGILMKKCRAEKAAIKMNIDANGTSQFFTVEEYRK